MLAGKQPDQRPGLQNEGPLAEGIAAAAAQDQAELGLPVAVVDGDPGTGDDPPDFAVETRRYVPGLTGNCRPSSFLRNENTARKTRKARKPPAPDIFGQRRRDHPPGETGSEPARPRPVQTEE
jgi:hypothetical protein